MNTEDTDSYKRIENKSAYTVLQIIEYPYIDGETISISLMQSLLDKAQTLLDQWIIDHPDYKYVSNFIAMSNETDGCGESTGKREMDLYVYFMRNETDEEYKSRMQDYQKQKEFQENFQKRQEEKDLALYLQLKEKFESKTI